MQAKRAFDVTASAIGLVVITPAFLLIALSIWLTDGRPIFFRQERVGENGKFFRILKFRTMIHDTERKGLQITSQNDSRITPVGRILRKTKLDEIPQLINVIKGEMSIVGPRPEVPKYVATYTPFERSLILSIPPGITDPASIKFRDESQLLAESKNADRTYIEIILPQKIAIYLDYIKNRTFLGDIKLILETLIKVII